MSQNPFRFRPGLRREWRPERDAALRTPDAFLRAGIAAPYLRRSRLEVPHLPQARLAESVPHCLAMVLQAYGREADADWLAFLLRTDEETGTSGRSLEWLRVWGIDVEFPRELQFYRDATREVSERLSPRPTAPTADASDPESATTGADPATGGKPEGRPVLVYRWEEPWLRYVDSALRNGIPPILFVDLGRLYSTWRGLAQPHAVVLTGGDGRFAWINDPAQPEGPTRVGLSSLMDALLPGEPLAALVQPMDPVSGPGGDTPPTGHTESEREAGGPPETESGDSGA